MESSPNGSRKRHVLVVEDDLPLASAFKELLEVQGYDVSLALNAIEAIRHVLANHTDAVVCDLQMPELAGDLFYATVEREQPALARRFVFISGPPQDEHYRQFFDRVNAPVLHKPFNDLALLVEVARMMVR